MNDIFFSGRNIVTYKYYRYLRSTGVESFRKLIFNEVGSGTSIIQRDDENFIALQKREFDSKFYDKNIWKINILSAENIFLAQKLIEEAISLAIKEGVQFLSIDLDSAYITYARLFEERGFHLAASKITHFCYSSQKHKTRYSKPIFTIRTPQDSEIENLQNLAKENMPVSLLERELFPEGKAAFNKNIYSVWVQKACFGEWADKVYLASRKDDICAFLSIRYDKNYKEVVGENITDDSGLAFATKIGKGAYVNLLDAMPTIYEQDAYGFTIESNSDNREVIRYCAARNFPAVGNKLIFHKLFI